MEYKTDIERIEGVLSQFKFALNTQSRIKEELEYLHELSEEQKKSLSAHLPHIFGVGHINVGYALYIQCAETELKKCYAKVENLQHLISLLDETLVNNPL